MKRRHVVNSSAFSLFSDFFSLSREKQKNRTKKSFTACSLQKFFSFFFSLSWVYLSFFRSHTIWQCDDYQWLNARYCLLYYSLLLNANGKINEKIKRPIVTISKWRFLWFFAIRFPFAHIYIGHITHLSSCSFMPILCFDIDDIWRQRLNFKSIWLKMKMESDFSVDIKSRCC